MRRAILVLFAAFALMAGFTASASAQDQFNCSDFISKAAAQSVFNADPSDPNGLDGNDNDGKACETYDYANNPGTNPGLLGGTTDDTGSGGGATDDDVATDDTGSGGDEVAEVPATGAGPLSSDSDSMLLVTALGGMAALLGFAGLHVRKQA